MSKCRNERENMEMVSPFFFFNFIYLFIDREREAETQAEGEVGSTQGARHGT